MRRKACLGYSHVFMLLAATDVTGSTHVRSDIALDRSKLYVRQWEFAKIRPGMRWRDTTTEISIRAKQNTGDANLACSFCDEISLRFPVSKTRYVGDVKVHLLHPRIVLL